MCGILGMTGSDIDLPNLDQALDTLIHRGPDWKDSVFLDNAVFLGHTRLSIIDLSPAGRQPMCNEDQTIWIIYNGEIYNFPELRTMLKDRGHIFKSCTDTEVIIHLYEEKGDECVKYLNGMFAFAIYDKRTKKIFLARDRLGIKPLYYTSFGGNLIFASEIKAMLKLKRVQKEVDMESLDKYMSFLWVPDPKTMFKNIYKLPPGHCLTYKDNNIYIKEYWDLRFQEKEMSEKAWVENILDKFEDIVRKHLISDVPLGIFLSGGVDSSAILAFMRKISGSSPKSYTTIFRRQDVRMTGSEDDSKYARSVAKLFKSDHTEIELCPDMVKLLPKIIYHMDEPVSDVSAIPTYLICQAAKEKLKVLLSGMGGDEIFAGYSWDLGSKLLDIYTKSNKPFNNEMNVLSRLFLNDTRSQFLRKVRKFIDVAKGRNGLLGFRTYITEFQKDNLYTERLKKCAENTYDAHMGYMNKVADKDMMTQMLYLDIKTFLPCLNLAYTDKMSMASSVEVRVPFLDHEFVELTASVPGKLKIKGIQQKYIYKKALKTILPKSILYRNKRGFGAPVNAWIKDMKPIIDDALSKKVIEKRGYFNYNFIEQIKKTGEHNWMNIWQLVVLELWHRTFIDT